MVEYSNANKQKKTIDWDNMTRFDAICSNANKQIEADCLSVSHHTNNTPLKKEKEYYITFRA